MLKDSWLAIYKLRATPFDPAQASSGQRTGMIKILKISKDSRSRELQRLYILDFDQSPVLHNIILVQVYGKLPVLGIRKPDTCVIGFGLETFGMFFYFLH